MIVRIRRLVFGVSLVAAAGCNLLTGAADLDIDATETVTPPSTLPDTGTPIPNLPETGPTLQEDGGPSDASRDGDAGDAKVDGEGGIVANAKRVFVTSARTTGDLNGLIKGDLMCMTAAQNESLGGTWVAWLSIQGGTEAVSRLSHNGPWYLVDRRTVAVTSKTQLVGAGIAHEINLDEIGATVANDGVWTGTRSGQFFQNDCNGWNVSTPVVGGQVGRTNTNGIGWTAQTANACASQQHIYCFEN